MNLTPASSSDLPSDAILTRVSESGTRLMQTAIFMALSVVRCQSSEQPQASSRKRLAVLRRRKTNPAPVIWQPLAAYGLRLHRALAPRSLRSGSPAHAGAVGREPALYRRARRRGVLG